MDALLFHSGVEGYPAIATLQPLPTPSALSAHTREQLHLAGGSGPSSRLAETVLYAVSGDVW